MIKATCCVFMTLCAGAVPGQTAPLFPFASEGSKGRAAHWPLRHVFHFSTRLFSLLAHTSPDVRRTPSSETRIGSMWCARSCAWFAERLRGGADPSLYNDV